MRVSSYPLLHSPVPGAGTGLGLSGQLHAGRWRGLRDSVTCAVAAASRGLHEQEAGARCRTQAGLCGRGHPGQCLGNCPAKAQPRGVFHPDPLLPVCPRLQPLPSFVVLPSVPTLSPALGPASARHFPSGPAWSSCPRGCLRPPGQPRPWALTSACTCSTWPRPAQSAPNTRRGRVAVGPVGLTG